MGVSEKFKDLWGKVTGVDEIYVDEEETQITEGELALDSNHYENYENESVSSVKAMRFAERTQHSLRIYKLRGQQWWEIATRVCDDFNEGCSVMINTEEANKDASVRMVDFLTGVAYSHKGRLVKNGATGFVIVPANCEIGGDIGEDIGDVGSTFGTMF